jgi:hypothetical protein
MLIEERVVDQKVIHMFTPEHSETEFLLNDGSRMRVCICKTCKDNRDLSSPETKEEIMDCVKNGWKLEARTLVQGFTKEDGTVIRWTPEQADKYIEEYSKKEIDCHCDGIPEHVLTERKEKVRKMLEDNKILIDESEKGAGVRD